MLVSSSGCTSISDYIRQGFRVGPDYKEPPAAVAPHWIEVHRLENEGDRLVRRAIADLFTNGGTDPIDVIKWKDLYSILEDTIDSCEDVANVIERIVVKHA